MNILNYDIKKTKLFKKIMISICSMIMVFASCFAPYSKVKALVGIDDVALSYVALSVLGLCGITLAGTTLSNTDITKLGSDVAGSISRTFDTLGKTVSDKWNLLVQTAGATGKIALDYVNDLKGNIQDWYNSLVPTSIETTYITAGIGATVSGGYLDTSKMDKTNFVYKIWNNTNVDGLLYVPSLNICISSIYMSYCTTCILYDPNKNVYILGINTMDCLPDIYKQNTISAYNYLYNGSTSKTQIKGGYIIHVDEHGMLPLIYSKGNYFVRNIVTGFTAYTTGLSSSSPNLNWKIIDKGGLTLDSLGKSDIPGSFKLDDRVLGATGALSLSDKIIGAVGSLDLDLTNNVVNSYGYVDVPSTTLDYPYTGTWDSTLDGIGAIAWAPSTDIPIADTNVIAPTLPGTTDTDIPKVKDFTGDGSQLSFDWKGVFPFCIPFDLIKFIQCFCADPEAPKFEIPVNIPKIYEGNIKVDLSDFDDVAALCRTLFDILFIIGLAYATRYLIKG